MRFIPTSLRIILRDSTNSKRFRANVDHLSRQLNDLMRDHKMQVGPSDARACTAAIVIPPGCDPDQMRQLADWVVTLTDLRSPANIMALLTPRNC